MSAYLTWLRSIARRLLVPPLPPISSRSDWPDLHPRLGSRPFSGPEPSPPAAPDFSLARATEAEGPWSPDTLSTALYQALDARKQTQEILVSQLAESQDEVASLRSRVASLEAELASRDVLG